MQHGAVHTEITGEAPDARYLAIARYAGASARMFFYAAHHPALRRSLLTSSLFTS